MRIWDPVMLLAMVFVSFVTPVEVAFIQGDGCIDGLFIANRVVEVIFYIDMALAFRMAYFDEKKGRWVREGRAILRNYLRGFFWIDVAAIVPLWPLGLNAGAGACSGAEVVADLADGMLESDDSLGTLATGARTIRLLRLLRLARMFKASRVLKQMLEDILMNDLSQTYVPVLGLEPTAGTRAPLPWALLLSGLPVPASSPTARRRSSS